MTATASTVGSSASASAVGNCLAPGDSRRGPAERRCIEIGKRDDLHLGHVREGGQVTLERDPATADDSEAKRTIGHASAATRVPTAGANLNPCPEHAEQTMIGPCRSITNASSAMFV